VVHIIPNVSITLGSIFRIFSRHKKCQSRQFSTLSVRFGLFCGLFCWLRFRCCNSMVQ